MKVILIVFESVYTTITSNIKKSLGKGSDELLIQHKLLIQPLSW